MPGLLTKSRVLMFGSDEPLLQIRSRVLNTAGCDTQIVCTYSAAALQLCSGVTRPELVVLCHTTDEDDAGKVRSLAVQVGVPTYYVEKLTPPQQLVADVRRLLKPNSWIARAASGGSSL
jgi:hypothetical protein